MNEEKFNVNRAIENMMHDRAENAWMLEQEREPSPNGNGRVEEVSAFRLTDAGNAERLAAQHRETIRYCGLWKKWLLYESGRWVRDHHGGIEAKALATARSFFLEAAEAKTKKASKELAKWEDYTETKKGTNAMVDMARRHVAVAPEAFDTNPWLLNVANGTLDLSRGEMRAHRAADLLTKCVSIAYDPTAAAPQWEIFLASIFQDNQELIGWLQKAIGYTLTGETREHCFFLLHGSGRNGKSTFLSTLKALLGEYGDTAAFTTFLQSKYDTIRNDLAALHACRFVAASEGEEGRRLSEAMIKQLTGGDAITARFLHAEYFTYTPLFKIWLATNHKPEIHGTDLAIWSRVKLIPFGVVFTGADQDKALGDKLLGELPGILAWAVRGCLAWQREGLTPEPTAVTAATQTYREEQDTLAAFLAEECLVGAHLTAPSTDLHQRFLEWCKRNAEPELSQMALAQRLEEKGFTKAGLHPITRRKQWRGLALAMIDR